MTAHTLAWSRRIRVGVTTFLEEGQKALVLFRQFMQVACNHGKPFEPVGYDFDSLENRDAEAMDRAVRMVTEPMQAYFRAEVHGLEHLPQGPVLFVGNHSGGMYSPEVFLFGGALFRRHGLGAMPYGLAHEMVAHVPPMARLLIPIGAVRASPENAARIFAMGRNALVYPGGDQEALRPSRVRDRIVFGGRRGYIRLALRHGVPIVPVVAFGAHDIFVVLDDGRWLAGALGLNRMGRLKVFPTILSLPWGVTAGPVMPFIPWPARIRIEVLAPIHFGRSGDAAAKDDRFVDECDGHVRDCMQASLTAMAVLLRTPRVRWRDVQRATPANDQWHSAERRDRDRGRGQVREVKR